MSLSSTMRPPLSRLIRVGGRAIHLRRTPAPGRPWAFFVHGHYGSARNWTDLSVMLHPGVDAVAMDLPGSGDSEAADCYCVPCTSATVAAAIRSVTDEPVHLVGNSYGGTVCLRLAATHPQLVRSLTLISPAVPFLNPSRSSQFSRRLLARLRQGERELVGLDPEGLVREVLAESCADPSAISQERITEFIEDARRAMATPWRREAQGRRFRGMVWELIRSYLPGPGSLRRLARGITQRTLVLWGNCDRVLDFRLSAGLAGLIPHGRFVLIDGAGHLPHLEAPRAVADAIEGFWQREPRSRCPAR